MKKRLLCLAALILTAALLLIRPPQPSQQLPGTHTPARRVLTVWTISSIGGGQAWLQKALSAYEKQHPGDMTYLRQVDAAEWSKPGAVLPDLVLFMPGDLPDGADLAPLSGYLPVDESLLRCGRWRGAQACVPVCWGAYVLAVSSALEPENLITPAPTTLFGRPSQTAAPAQTEPPGYPYEAAANASEALQCAPGAGMFSLRLLLSADRSPALPDSFGTLDQNQVYARFASGACASAVLTTGQAVALDGRILSGDAAPCRYLVPDEIITDQVWLAAVTQNADSSAADLLAWLLCESTQRTLSAQALHPARSDLRLYAAGVPAQVDRAAARSLTIINAFVPREQTAQVARQAYLGGADMNAALLPLL